MNHHIKKLLTPHQYDQIIDRTYLIQEIINNTLIQHPIYKIEKEYSEKIKNAMNCLLEACQIAVTLKDEIINENIK